MKSKKFWKIIGLEICFLLLTVLAACAAAWLQYVGRQYVRSYNSLFAGTVYQYHWLAYAGGLMGYFACVWFSYQKIMKKQVRLLMECPIVCSVVFWVICAVFCFGMFCALVIVMFLKNGFAGYMQPEFLEIVTFMGWPVATAAFVTIDMVIQGVKARKKNPETL